MHKYFLFSLLLAVLMGTASAAVLAERGQSNYSIVVPDCAGQHMLITRYYREAANELRDMFKESTGVVLPIVSEADFPSGKPGIYIGATKRAAGLGLDKLELSPWETVTVTDNGDIILYGADRVFRKQAKDYNDLLLGSVRAVSLFMRDVLGVRYLMPTASGRSAAPHDRLEFNQPEPLRNKPDFVYISGRPNGIFYDYANNFLPMPFYGSYGGHSHDKAVPGKKYFESHPEYFAIVNGKRNRTQVCLSNPEVREMIFQNLLKRADEGYDWVQLAQADGFAGCECPKCKAALGTGTWGEKLWEIHREMAERFARERPGKKVVILAYTVTRKPPEKFKEFPGNVMIELCHYAKDDFKAWNSVKGVGGLTVYVYNWGYYKDEGFSPSLSPSFVPEQLELFRNSNVKAIYRCGFGELFGLEGPVYYTYGQLAGDASRKLQSALNEYYERAFGPAAAQMAKFFGVLYERVNDGRYPEPDWSDFMYGITIKLYENQRLMVRRYPARVLSELDAILTAAEQTPNLDEAQKHRLHLTRIEFDYLKYSAALAEAFLKWLDSGKKEGLLPPLRSAFEARNHYIDSLYGSNEKVVYDDFNMFYGCPRATLLNGGRFRGVMKGAFGSELTPEKW